MEDKIDKSVFTRASYQMMEESIRLTMEHHELCMAVLQVLSEIDPKGNPKNNQLIKEITTIIQDATLEIKRTYNKHTHDPIQM